MYRTPPKYHLTPSGAPRSFAPGPFSRCNPPSSAQTIRHISRMYGSRVHAHAPEYVTSRIQNSERARGCPLHAMHCPREQRERERKWDKERERERENRERESRVSLTKGRFTMPKRARIIVRPTDNGQCAKCIEIKSGQFIFAPTSARFNSFSRVGAVMFSRVKNLLFLEWKVDIDYVSRETISIFFKNSVNSCTGQWN